MTSVIELYEQISSAPDEKTRARLIVEAIEHVERRFPAVNDLATNASLRETELRLQKEIEQLRAETAHHKLDIIKWTLGALLAHTALILGGMRYFFG